MSVSNLRHRSPGREHLVRQNFQRDVNVAHVVGVPRSEATVDASSSSSAPSAQPASVKVLIAFVVIFGVAVIGLLAWRIGVWRRRRLREASTRSMARASAEKGPASSSYRISLSNSGDGHDEKIGDLEAYMLPNPLPAVHSPDKAIRNGTNRFLGSWSFRRSTSPTSAQQLLPQAHQHQAHPFTQASAFANFKSPTSSTKANLGTPGIGATLQLVGTPSPDRPVTPSATLTLEKIKEAPKSPIPSPRTASCYGPDSPVYKASAANRPRSKSLNGKKLPRLMTVVYTFVPSLADELSVKLGETLRLLEEYEDEWCLVQRVGRPDAEKGVIPRFCLQERPEVIGSLPRHKKAMSSLHYVQSARP